jgi:hypothetical protein
MKTHFIVMAMIGPREVGDNYLDGEVKTVFTLRTATEKAATCISNWLNERPDVQATYFVDYDG